MVSAEFLAVLVFWSGKLIRACILAWLYSAWLLPAARANDHLSACVRHYRSDEAPTHSPKFTFYACCLRPVMKPKSAEEGLIQVHTAFLCDSIALSINFWWTNAQPASSQGKKSDLVNYRAVGLGADPAIRP